jgi:glucose/arabinose dehydrogenase
MTSRRLAALAGAVAGAGVVWLVALTPRTRASEPPAIDGPPRVATQDNVELLVEPVATGLRTVWDMTWAPDGQLWFTERGGRVSRLDVRRGEVTPVGDVLDVAERGESGLMGLALHPDFPREPWVYFVHSYSGGTPPGIRNRLIRMRYANGRLADPQTLIDGMMGAANHDGARVAIGPDRLLYLTMGDASRMPLAQDTMSLNGKILRLTLDGVAAPGNPFNNAVWSWGHRNPQGLVFHPATKVLYSAEHGPATDDEVNRIEGGRNYGWPAVHGLCDRPTEQIFCRSTRIVEPIQVWTPTLGISGADFYNFDSIPGWKGSLLVTALAGQSLLRLTLSADGKSVTASERLLSGRFGRLRDVLTGPDGSVYLATSNRDGRGRPRETDDQILRLRAVRSAPLPRR